MHYKTPLALSALLAILSAVNVAASPPLATLEDRARVDAPPSALPTEQTQRSPVMTITVDGEVVVYTQMFSAVPDQWPTPAIGKIGLGNLEGEVGGTGIVGRRGAPVETAAAGMEMVGRCRTWECRLLLEGGGRGSEWL